MQFKPVAELWGLDEHTGYLAFLASLALMAVTHICAFRPLCQVSFGALVQIGLRCLLSIIPNGSDALKDLHSRAAHSPCQCHSIFVTDCVSQWYPQMD